MPVEESGNLLILADAMSQEQGNWDFVPRLLAAVHPVGPVSARQGPRSRKSAFDGRFCGTSRAQLKSFYQGD